MLTKRVVVALLLAVVSLLPAAAQDLPVPEPAPTEIVEYVRVDHDGIRFAFDALLADAVLMASYPAEEGDVQVPSPAYTEFTFEGYGDGPYVNRAPMPRVDIYRIEDFGPFPAFIDQLDALSSLLAERPDLNQYVSATPGTSDALTLPFLPIIPAAQVLRALPKYIDVANVSGIRYLVYYSQAPNPVLEGEMFYTFQGITDDGQHYVAVMLPINTGGLPTEEPAAADPDEWMAGYQDYLLDLLGSVTASAGREATPPLSVLDALAQSVTVSR